MVPLTSRKGGVSHHQVSGREHGFGQARWTAHPRPPLWLVLSPPREWRDPRLDRIRDDGGTGRRRLRGRIVSTRHGGFGTHELSRAMTARFRCTGPEATVPAAPPGDRPGVSLHQWS